MPNYITGEAAADQYEAFDPERDGKPYDGLFEVDCPECGKWTPVSLLTLLLGFEAECVECGKCYGRGEAELRRKVAEIEEVGK